MEGVSPNLNLLLRIKFGLESGEPLKIILEKYLESEQGSLPKKICLLLIARQSGQHPQAIIDSERHLQRQALLGLIVRGLGGDSIYSTLCSLEPDFRESSALELDRFLSLLPTKMLIPLLLFLFPSFLILLFGPIVENFLHFK